MALNVPSRVPESGVREGSRGVCPLLGGTTILVLRNISNEDKTQEHVCQIHCGSDADSPRMTCVLVSLWTVSMILMFREHTPCAKGASQPDPSLTACWHGWLSGASRGRSSTESVRLPTLSRLVCSTESNRRLSESDDLLSAHWPHTKGDGLRSAFCAPYARSACGRSQWREVRSVSF